MTARLDLGQISNTGDILRYLDECINDDGISAEELIPWLDDVAYSIQEANEEFQRKYGGY